MARHFPIQTEDSQCPYSKKCGDLGQTGTIVTWPREFWKFPCNNTLAIGFEVYSDPVLGEKQEGFEKHETDVKYNKNNGSDPVMDHDLKFEKHCSMTCQIANSWIR